MVDHHFSDVGLAALYDVFHPSTDREDFDFYLPMIMSAESVLDAGCGTGALLKLARDSGHTGRLCGLDPAHGMLEQARRRTDIEWVAGDLASPDWVGEFDLVVMTGHAFQVLVADEVIRASLAAVRRFLKDEGRFAFETRNPLARAWEVWTPENAAQVVDASGSVVRMTHAVKTPVEGDTITFTTSITSPASEDAQLSESTLRFLGPGELATFLIDAGLAIDEQFGGWDSSPLTDGSPEIITIARRSV
jgi:ubiquinone/menaquinone biosynthesis C-methylase UbiE